jgi:hypothetical protein
MQTTYDFDYPIGIEGQKIEDVVSETVTGIAEAGPIGVGKLVVLDTTAGRADKSVRAPAASGDVTGAAVVGVSLWDPTFPFQTGFGAPITSVYPQYKTLPVMRKGRILLASETVIAKGVHPFVRFAAGGGGTVLGSIRADADSASAVVAPYLTIITPATAAGGLIVVEINL